MSGTVYQFENYILDTEKRRLFRDGKPVNTDFRTIQLLQKLIEATPDWMDKNTLLDELWPDQEITDWALSRLVSDTRKLLGDDGDNQRIIRTVRGRGFEFCAPFEIIESGAVNHNRDQSISVTNRPAKAALWQWAIAGMTAVLFAVILMNQTQPSSIDTLDVTGVVNVGGEDHPHLSNLLEDWASSQNDMFYVEKNTHDRLVTNKGLFNHYCNPNRCSQLIILTPLVTEKTSSYKYVVFSREGLEEDRELISSIEDFLISALRDAIASTMNRSSDYFALPLALYMQHSDTLYQDMYRLHINLQNTFVTFLAQVRRRNELVKLISTRLNVDRKQQYEQFFITYFDQLNREEKFIFDQIRAMTSGTLYQGNRNILTLLENNPDLIREIPKLEAVRKHLAFWMNKYNQLFATREDMCLLYVGVEDGVPFPSGIDQLVSDWLKDNGNI